jgi:hypothetical protein
VPVQVVETSKANPFEMVQIIIAPLLGPLGTAALVLVLVICMLFQREDLRSRLIRLIGQGRISATTRAMDDAGHRVSRYLLLPTAREYDLRHYPRDRALFHWGAQRSVMGHSWDGPPVYPLHRSMGGHDSSDPPGPRSFAALDDADSHRRAFRRSRVALNNVMEPLLYGAHTGVSSIALIVAAVFWTWLWGPLGLVLATPLTVCLVVMGRMSRASRSSASY